MEHETQRTVRITQFERAIEETMRPGNFIGYREDWDFVQDLEGVSARVMKLIPEGHATDAVQILETFLAASYETVAEVRRAHGRKRSFMPGFERVPAGGPAAEPQSSFLERARRRWPRGGG